MFVLIHLNEKYTNGDLKIFTRMFELFSSKFYVSPQKSSLLFDVFYCFGMFSNKHFEDNKGKWLDNSYD